jgi:hypothetical protein
MSEIAVVADGNCRRSRGSPLFFRPHAKEYQWHHPDRPRSRAPEGIFRHAAASRIMPEKSRSLPIISRRRGHGARTGTTNSP